MAKIKDLRVVVGTYEKNGEQKNRYATVGAVFEGSKGMVAKLDLIPTNPEWDGTLFFNDPYEVKKEQFNEGIAQARNTLQTQNKIADDDIPF